MTPAEWGRGLSQRPGHGLPPLPVLEVQTGTQGFRCIAWGPRQGLQGMPMGSAPAVWGGVSHRSLVGLLVEGLPKDCNHKEIDEEGDRQGDGGLNQEVHVRFADVCPAGPVYLSRL